MAETYKVIDEEDPILAGIELKRKVVSAARTSPQLERIKLPDDPFDEEETAEKKVMGLRSKAIFTEI